MKKYVIVETWNGEGYSTENFITEVTEFENDDAVQEHCENLVHDNQTFLEHMAYKLEDGANGHGWGTFNDDDGSYQFFELKPTDYGVIIKTNVNEVEVVDQKTFRSHLEACTKAYDGDLDDIRNNQGLFFSNEDHGYYAYAEDSDLQFQEIDIDLKEYDIIGGDGVENEIWEHKTNKHLIEIPIEIVRDLDNIKYL